MRDIQRPNRRSSKQALEFVFQIRAAELHAQLTTIGGPLDAGRTAWEEKNRRLRGRRLGRG